MGLQVANNAAGNLAAAIQASDSQIRLQTGQGSKFPVASVASGNYFYVTLINLALTTAEVVKVLDRTGDVLTVQRGQDNTTATSFALGEYVECRFCAAVITDLFALVGVKANQASTLAGYGITDALLASVAASTYQTQAGMSAYQTVAGMSAYQTVSGMSAYQTVSGMSAYLTTASAASTYQTLTGMSSYLTTAAAASAYAPLTGAGASGTWGISITGTAAQLGGVAASSYARKDVAQTFTAQQTPMNGTITDGATVSWDANVNGQVVAITLNSANASRTFNNPTNVQQYALYIVRVTQDATTAGRTISWSANYKFGTSGAPTLTTTVGKTDILSFIGGAGNTLEYLGIRKDAV